MMRSEELVTLTNLTKPITDQNSMHNFKSRSHSDNEEEHQGWPIRVQRLFGRWGVRIKEPDDLKGYMKTTKFVGSPVTPSRAVF